MKNNIEQLVEALGFRSRRALALSLGLSPSTLKNFAQGRQISPEVAQAIRNAYPHVSLEWLLTGKGEMFAAPEQANWRERLAELEAENERLKRENEEWKSRVEKAELEMLRAKAAAYDAKEKLEKKEKYPRPSTDDPGPTMAAHEK